MAHHDLGTAFWRRVAIFAAAAGILSLATWQRLAAAACDGYPYDCCNGVNCWIIPPGTTVNRCFHVINIYGGAIEPNGCTEPQADQARDPNCPWSGINNGHGQCTGSHVVNNGYHSNPYLVNTISPGGLSCAPGNGIVCYNVTTPPYAGAYKLGVFARPCQYCPGGSTQDFYIWVKLNASDSGLPLSLLGNDPANYNRVGYQDWHNPLYADPQDSNHWGTAATVSATAGTAHMWLGGPQPPDVTCTDRPILYINDMALSLGGLYDINQNWLAPHSSHGDGHKVDIRSIRGRTDGTGVPLGSEHDFCSIAKYNGFTKVYLECDPATGQCGSQPANCDSLTCSGCPTHWHLVGP